ncbi:hypothetical protein [Methylophaga nitratireducenticrescens]|uniref:hypothetical protein n=1 Tax=Methylophaga nitratireducenticrescens TaxID=754476 RepID=UPI000CDC1853|nr:hypothetical protein [Methylophaga nitratireducenticrescens]AUZ85034.1 hypothetical protein CDW43_10825 [Methylophaga nitratireducenticrescens]
MTVHFFSSTIPPLPILFKQSAIPLVWLCLLGLFMSISSVEANDENTQAFTAEFAVLDKNNLPQYVSRMSQRYYAQVDLLNNYFQLFQQKKDPRGFNVWHLRGFLPNFSLLDAENQHVAESNENFLAERPEKELTLIFTELKEVSVNLMVSFRENDPEAYKAASTQVKSHIKQLTEILKTHHLGDEIRESSLN